MTSSHFLSPDELSIQRRDDGVLLLQRDGQSIELSSPRRALPLSNPDEFIVLSDGDGQELGVLRAVADLDDASQAVLRQALSQAYRMERITRVLEVEREALTGQTRWRVEVEIARDAPDEAGDDTNAAGNETNTTTAPNATLRQPTALDGSIAEYQPAASPGAAASASPSASPSTFNGSAPSRSRDANEGDSAEGDAGQNDANDKDDNREDNILLRPLRIPSLRRGEKDKDEGDEADVQAEEREFLISGAEDVQTARYPHIFIVDTERNRYEIPDCEALDLESRRAAERFF